MRNTRLTDVVYKPIYLTEYIAMKKSCPLRVRLRIDLSTDVSIGPGKVALLEGIVRTGSLSAAARELGMSYRRGWLLVHSVNESFRLPVVRFSTGGKDGGGTELTPFGRKLIEAYRKLEASADRLARECFAGIARELTEPEADVIARRPVRKKTR